MLPRNRPRTIGSHGPDDRIAPDLHVMATPLEASRAAARAVRDRLHGMLTRRASGRIHVQPGELPMCFDRAATSDWRGPALFHCMACTVVSTKYSAPGYERVLAALARERALAAGALDTPGGPSREETDAVRDSGSWLRTTQRRLGVHQTRWSHGGDVDLHVCTSVDYSRFGGNALPWVFQQDDLRYRWSSDAERKLRYLADCWDAYSGCDFTLADAPIGAREFPLFGRLRAEPAPAPPASGT